jgi:hypothetical protein
MRRFLIACLPLLALPAACSTTDGEGRTAAECTDGVDNDDDGDLDCDDVGCTGYDACEGGGDDTSGGDSEDTGSPMPDLVADPEVKLNEFMASNATAWADPHHLDTHPDWIELYNLTAKAVSLGGYTITDDFGDPDKAVLGADLTLPASGFLILIADNDPEEGSAHLPFKLARMGESLALYRSDGTALDATRYTEQDTDSSMARSPDGGDTWVTDPTSTPGTSNAAR